MLHVFPSVTCFSLLPFARLIVKALLPRLEINSSSRLNVFHSDELRKEARQLKKELLAIKQRKEDGVKKEEDVSEGECLCHKITAVCLSVDRIWKSSLEITRVLWNFHVCTVSTAKNVIYFSHMACWKHFNLSKSSRHPNSLFFYIRPCFFMSNICETVVVWMCFEDLIECWLWGRVRVDNI